MASDSLQTIIRRAVMEPEFRGLLMRDPAQALAGYELGEAEAAQLSGLTAEGIDSLALDLEERQSRASFGLGGFAAGTESMGFAAGTESMGFSAGSQGRF
jgi:hypothetical protein